ncbi:glycosyltransferase [Chlorobium phaeobacteroides]|uniref:glycosyltransferase n=1 Tax=Chlorobium phaeobacteroides TaxID=1096 RepID=UPI000326BA4A|nr:glycosyltransferase [Chlorobium phaeobacteroides]
MRSVRKPRLLWANCYCLLDTSSGASISVREMLRQLARMGFEVAIIGATIFDSETGMSVLPANWKKRLETVDILVLSDPPLVHKLLMTNSHIRDRMMVFEEAKWYELYLHTLDSFSPDIVWFYGGRPFDYLIADEAKHRGIPVAAYLANGNYTKTRWCRDVDLIVCDSQATAGYYRARNGISPLPVGKFIDPDAVVAQEHVRRNTLFVNPSLEKGAALVVQIAMRLEKQRPDIRFEVVSSRGNWSELVRSISALMGTPRDALENVLLTRHATDMRPVYARARIVLAPSLWWESGSRVLAEAMLNAVPAIVTDRGGNVEMIGGGGVTIALPERFYQKPYMQLLDQALLDHVVGSIIELYDSESTYNGYIERAGAAGKSLHDMASSSQKLLHVMRRLLPSDAIPSGFDVPTASPSDRS